jgi:hypothetical protein
MNRLTLANFFIKTHNANGDNIVDPNTTVRVSIQKVLSCIQRDYSLTTEDMKGMIVYAYAHNPLNVNLREYSQVNRMRSVVGAYLAWVNRNKALIEKRGLLEAISDTSNEYDDVDAYVAFLTRKG